MKLKSSLSYRQADQKDIRLTKQKIRTKMLVKLKTQKEEEQERKSKIIKEKLLALRIFKKAKVVMFYIAFGGEVKTEEMIKITKKLGKIVCVPVLRRRSGPTLSGVKASIMKKDKVSIRPVLVENRIKLVRGLYGVAEPAIKKAISLQDLDLVIVPGLAFDRKGNRLGRGKGCYDQFMKELPERTNTIGLAFDFQILPSVPTTIHDVSVKKVLFA
jgi:5-formyltetrahydrofolate cyclo-ligase